MASDQINLQTSGKTLSVNTVNRQVFPQPPSPTITNLRRVSGIGLRFN
jgi:hypothetical protein